MLHRGEHFPHNYNAVSRSAFYTWLNRHFKLGFKEPVIERDYGRLTRTELTVWDAQHPKPPGGDLISKGSCSAGSPTTPRSSWAHWRSRRTNLPRSSATRWIS